MLNNSLFEGVTLQKVKSQFKPNCSKIILLIDSIGGEVEEAERIAIFLKSTGKRIETIVTGKCYSIATLLFLLPEKSSERFIMPGSVLMIHSPFLTGFNCDAFRCDGETLDYVAGEVKKSEEKLLTLYNEKTGLDITTLKNMLKRETYLTANQAVSLGFAGAIMKTMGMKNVMKGLKDAILAAFTTVIAAIELQLEDGTAVYVDSEDGDLTGKPGMYSETGEPLPAGEHKLQDGRVLRVGEGGIIESITEIGAMKEETAMYEETAMKETDMKEEMTAMDESKIQNLVTEAGNILQKIGATSNPDEAKKLQSSLDVIETKIASIQKFLALKQKEQELKEKFAQKTPQTPTAIVNVGASKDPEQSKKNLFYKWLGVNALEQMDARDKNDVRVSIANTGIVTPDLNYTYNGLENINQLFYKPTLETPDVKRIFEVRQGVKSREQLFRVLPFGNEDLLRAAQGCNPTPRAITDAVIDNRVLETDDIGDELEQCYTSFQNIIFQEWLKTGADIGNLTGTMVERIILGLLQDGIRRGFFRLFSFGDKNDVGNPAYSPTDGMWTKLIQGVSDYDPSDSGANYCATRIDNITTLNSGATTSAEYYLRRLYENAPNLLRGMSTRDKGFFVTQNVYDTFLTNLEARTATELAFRLLEDGTKELSFRGIPIVPVLMWDDLLRNGTAPVQDVANTLMLYTTAQNHVIGIDKNNDEHRVLVWYDFRDDVLRFRTKFKLGYQFVQCDLQALSYGIVS